MQTSITLGKFVKEFELENLTPHIEFESIPLTQKYVNRPALQLTGFFDHFEGICGDLEWVGDGFGAVLGRFGVILWNLGSFGGNLGHYEY